MTKRFSGIFFFFLGEGRAFGEVGRGNKSQLLTRPSTTLSLLYRVHLGHFCHLLEGRTLWGVPGTLLTFSDTHPSRESPQTHSICCCFHFSQSRLVRCLSANLPLCRIFEVWVPFLGPRGISEMQSRIPDPPLILTGSSIPNTHFTFVLETPVTHIVQALQLGEEGHLFILNKDKFLNLVFSPLWYSALKQQKRLICK